MYKAMIYVSDVVGNDRSQREKNWGEGGRRGGWLLLCEKAFFVHSLLLVFDVCVMLLQMLRVTVQYLGQWNISFSCLKCE